MRGKIEINEYLASLKANQSKTVRPFDRKSSGPEIEMGPAAQALVIPSIPIEKIMPPQKDTINRLYALFKPVVDELEGYEEFDWQQNYGTLSAESIAKGYLFNAITRSMLKTGVPFTPEEIGLQVFLRHVSDAYVDKIKAEDAVAAFLQRPHVQSQFSSMLQSMSVSKPTKQDLIDYFCTVKSYNLAYQASLFDAADFEKNIANSVNSTLMSVNSLFKTHNRPSFWSKGKEIKLPEVDMNNDELHAALQNMASSLAEIAKTDSKKLMKETLVTLNASSNFFKNEIGNISEHRGEIKEQIKTLQHSLHTLAEKLQDDKEKHRPWVAGVIPAEGIRNTLPK